MKYDSPDAPAYPGTNTLINKFDLKDRKELDRHEAITFTIRHNTAPDGDLSLEHLKQIHHHLLQDVYDWAGEFRDVPTSRGSSRFAQPQYIEKCALEITNSVDIAEFKKLSRKDFAEILADIIGELNAIHPFLDGNGRAIRLYAQKLAKAVGFDFEVFKLDEKSWNAAAVSSFNTDLAPLSKIIRESLVEME